MSKISVKDRDIVVPGDILAEGMDFLPAGGAFREKESVIASQVGIVSISGRLIRVIPLSGRYIPKRGDNVIGKITLVSISNWLMDIGYANEAMLQLKEAVAEFVPRGTDLTNFYKSGDYVLVKIINVTKTKFIDVSMRGPGLRKLGPGRIIQVASSKVPRIIGKEGSMITMIKDITGCRITIGQNGVTWISGDDPDKEIVAVDAIRLIEKKSHKTGLTEEVKKFLESKIKIKPKKEEKKEDHKKEDVKGEKKNVQKKK